MFRRTNADFSRHMHRSTRPYSGDVMYMTVASATRRKFADTSTIAILVV